jgi:hypothetical protein
MVVAKVIENTDTPTLDKFVRRVVDKDKADLIATDEHSGYRLLGEGPDALPQEVVTHSAVNMCGVSFTLRISRISGAF